MRQGEAGGGGQGRCDRVTELLRNRLQMFLLLWKQNVEQFSENHSPWEKERGRENLRLSPSTAVQQLLHPECPVSSAEDRAAGTSTSVN